MKYFDWSIEKNNWLLKTRNITFEDVVMAIESGGLLNRLKHPNKLKYPNQFILHVRIGDYIYTVPCVEDDRKIFLKTIIPDRKATRHYLKGKEHEEE